jgi:hypothetical protein
VSEESLMPQWWEVALPIAGTLGGTIIGGLAQGWNSRRQTKDQARHQRDTLVMNEKIKLYAEILGLAYDARRAKRLADVTNEEMKVLICHSPPPRSQRSGTNHSHRGQVERRLGEATNEFIDAANSFFKLSHRVEIYAPSDIRAAYTRVGIPYIENLEAVDELCRLVRHDLGVEEPPKKLSKLKKILPRRKAPGASPLPVGE